MLVASIKMFNLFFGALVMKLQTEFNAQKREFIGKGASRRLRKDGLIPAIIYGTGVDPVSIILSHDELNHAQEFTEFYESNLTIKVDGKDFVVKVQDMQRHAYKPKLLHLDFKTI